MLERWKSEKIENYEGIKKWENKKDLEPIFLKNTNNITRTKLSNGPLVFPHLYLVGGVEKLRNEKLFCLVEIKNVRIENKVNINLPLCPY